MIKGRAVESLEAYLELARTGRRAPMGRLQRTQVWELMECWDAQMVRHGTIDFADVTLRALEHARRRSRPSYSAVIVDEAQDLTLAGLQFLRALVNAPDREADRPDGLFILGDGAQRIYPGGFTLRQAGVEVRGRTTVLTENYRNTSEIVDAAIAVAGDHRIEDLGEVFERGAESISTVRRGPRPLLIKIEGLDAQIDEIARYVGNLVGTDDGFGPGDMAVLAPSNAAVNRVRGRLQDPRPRGAAAGRLTTADPPIRSKSAPSTGARVWSSKSSSCPNSTGSLLSRRRGLSDDEAAEARGLAISQLFVAMTRARDLLVILHGPALAAEVAAASGHFERPRGAGPVRPAF